MQSEDGQEASRLSKQLSVSNSRRLSMVIVNSDQIYIMKTKQVESWLENSQSRIPYELDFYTPFKEMATKQPVQAHPKMGTEDNHTYPIEKSRETFNDSHEYSSEGQSSDSSGRYRRRPRHKPRDDYYHYKGGKIARVQRKKRRLKKASGTRRVRRPLNMLNEYRAPNVESERLTLKRKAGFLEQGRASAPQQRRGLPDLAFPEKMFLNLGKEWSKQLGPRYRSEVQEKDSCSLTRQKRAEGDDLIRKVFDKKGILDDAYTPELHRNKNHAFEYQTPCRKAKPLANPSHERLELDLLDRPYLGFGKPGPAVDNMAANAQRESSRSSAHVTSPPVGTATRASTRMPSRDKISTDPRAQHSPTSNFQFARKQLARTRGDSSQQARIRSKETQKEAEDKQEEILSLLRQLYDQKAHACDEHMSITSEQTERNQPSEVRQGSDQGQSQTAGSITGIKQKLQQVLQTSSEQDLACKLSELLKGLERPNQKSAHSSRLLETTGHQSVDSRGNGDSSHQQQQQGGPNTAGRDDGSQAAPGEEKGLEETHLLSAEKEHVAGLDAPINNHHAIDMLPAIGLSRPASRVPSTSYGITSINPPLGPPFYINQAQLSAQLSNPKESRIKLGRTPFSHSRVQQGDALLRRLSSSTSTWRPIRTAHSCSDPSISRQTLNSRASINFSYPRRRNGIPTEASNWSAYVAGASYGREELDHVLSNQCDDLEMSSTLMYRSVPSGFPELSEVDDTIINIQNQSFSEVQTDTPATQQFWKPHVLY